MVSRLLLLIVTASSVAWPSEIVWTELTPLFSYRDLTTNCKTDGYFRHYLAAEVERGQVKAAVLRAGGTEVFYERTQLTPEEMKGLRYESDSYDRLWLVEYRLSSRMLQWIFMNSGSSLDGCKPTKALVSVTPESHPFRFPIESLGSGPVKVSSDYGKFSGKRQDGRAYQAGIYFIQSQMKVGSP